METVRGRVISMQNTIQTHTSMYFQESTYVTEYARGTDEGCGEQKGDHCDVRGFEQTCDDWVTGAGKCQQLNPVASDPEVACRNMQADPSPLWKPH